MPSYSPLLLLVEQSLISQGSKFQTKRRVWEELGLKRSSELQVVYLDLR